MWYTIGVWIRARPRCPAGVEALVALGCLRTAVSHEVQSGAGKSSRDEGALAV